jgi:hypothetical protein
MKDLEMMFDRTKVNYSKIGQKNNYLDNHPTQLQEIAYVSRI